MYPIYKYTTLMMRSQSSLYNFSLIMAGMYVGRLLRMGTGFGKLLNLKTSVVIFPIYFSSKPFLIPRRIQPDIITNVNWSSCKVQIVVKF